MTPRPWLRAVAGEVEREPLPSDLVEDLGRMLGEALAAQWRRNHEPIERMGESRPGTTHTPAENEPRPNGEAPATRATAGRGGSAEISRSGQSTSSGAPVPPDPVLTAPEAAGATHAARATEGRAFLRTVRPEPSAHAGTRRDPFDEPDPLDDAPEVRP